MLIESIFELVNNTLKGRPYIIEGMYEILKKQSPNHVSFLLQEVLRISLMEAGCRFF